MLRFFRQIAWVFAVVMMAGTLGCISKNLNENAGTTVEFLAFAEPNSAGTQIFKHQIDAIYNGGNDENSYTGIVKWTREELTIIATSELGRLCKIQFLADGKIEQSCAAFLPEKVRENLWRGLRDFQLIFYSAEQINEDRKFFASEEFSENSENSENSEKNSVPAKVRSIYRVPAGEKSVPANAVPELIITFQNPEKPLAQQTIFVECERWKYRYKLTPIQ